MSPTEINCQVFWNQYLTLLLKGDLMKTFTLQSSFTMQKMPFQRPTKIYFFRGSISPDLPRMITCDSQIIKSPPPPQ